GNLNIGGGAGVDAVIDRLVTAASRIFKTLTSRRIAREVYTSELYDGDRAGSSRSELWLREFPVNSVSLVKENGVALTVGTGYSRTSDVILVGDVGILIRQSGGERWAPGRQNIEITDNAGWDYPRV